MFTSTQRAFFNEENARYPISEEALHSLLTMPRVPHRKKQTRTELLLNNIKLRAINEYLYQKISLARRIPSAYT
jgi:hypothetical protein